MTWAVLRDLLAERYDDFRNRLTRQLGSEELARETLHETWIRLHRHDDIGPVQSPVSYLMRVALNIATDFRRADARRARQSERRAALEIPDLAPGPAREAEGRAALKTLRGAIDALPARTRDILIAARLEGVPQLQIAERFGISPRMVRIELRRALDHCEACLENGAQADFPSGSRQTSIEQPHPRSVAGPDEEDGTE